jgi:hypothetical protein
MVSEPKPGGALLFVGDDWAEDHRDIEIVDDTGQVLHVGSTPGTNGDEEPMTSEFVAMPARHTPHVWEVDGQVRGNVNLHLGSRGGF